MNRTVPEGDHYDVLVIGSGFGGSVTALRLTEKGYRVGVLEAGRRWADDEFAATSWDLKRFVWAPKLGLMGVQRIHALPDVVVLAGAGVGGGSLNYANTLYEPQSSAFYNDPQWASITDWRTELAPYYDQAKRMLGVVPNPTMTLADRINLKVAEEMGVDDTFRMAPVGVFFGPDGTKKPGVEVDDPFFGGVGPRRRGCLEVGECMVGCRHGAKNTLVKNYLYLAEQAGAVVHPETTVVRVTPGHRGGYTVDTMRSGAWRTQRARRMFTADQVVFAAGTWGTQHLLHRLKRDGSLPDISERLGVLTRTNSEALTGASVKLRHRGEHDFTAGVAITSSFHPDEYTHIEPVRYGKGQNAMGLLSTLMTDGGGSIPRPIKWLGQALRHPLRLLAHYAGMRRWSENSTIALVMQTFDNSITVQPKRGLFGRYKLTSTQGHGLPNPTWIPAANEAVRRMAAHIDGYTWGSVGEIFDIPMTAHFLGGCTIGGSSQTGVIDPYQRMYGHPGLHVVDGSAISANLGVNPSLTITAQAERAMSYWPNKGEPDPRPAVGAGYRRLPPVPPRSPVVPVGAPGALRLPQPERP
jgi:cholesterol oxidase